MKLNDDIIKLFKIFKENNFILYIIGGAVRDYLLNRPIDDYDFATSATPNEMIKILDGYKLDTYQSKLGSIKVNINKRVYEITTFRKELGVKDIRYPEKTVFVRKLEEDVQRRDFKINTLAYNPDYGIVDCLNGINDLKLKQIKFVKNTIESINEDPIRLVRALRFSLLLDFSICNDDIEIFNHYAYLVKSLGKIKYDELLKLFKINGCKEFILKYFNIYKQVYKELGNEICIDIFNSDIDEESLKYVLFLNVDDYNLLDFNKTDKLIIKGIKSIDLTNHDLYYTKLLMIEYKELLNKILIIMKYLNYDSSKILENIKIIQDEKHCLSIKELEITYLDLERLNIQKKDYAKVFNYLFDLVLKDNSLNKYDQLIELIKKGC